MHPVQWVTASYAHVSRQAVIKAFVRQALGQHHPAQAARKAVHHACETRWSRNRQPFFAQTFKVKLDRFLNQSLHIVA